MQKRLERGMFIFAVLGVLVISMTVSVAAETTGYMKLTDLVRLYGDGRQRRSTTSKC